MNKIALSLLFGLGLMLGTVLASRPAEATVTLYNAADTCVWDPAFDLRPTFEGYIKNYEISGVEHRVSCGLARPNIQGPTTTNDVQVYFWDGNNRTGMEDNVYCNVYSCNTFSSTCTNEGTLFGDASGGTTTPGSTFTGSGYISFADINAPAFSVVNVTCAIPVDVGSESRVNGFYVNY